MKIFYLSAKYYKETYFLFTFLLFVFTGLSQTNTMTAGTIWSTGTWSLGHAPLSTENAVINAGLSVQINAPAICATLQINNSTGNGVTTSLTINSSQTLTVGAGTGLVTIGNGGTGMGNGNTSTTSLIVNGNLLSGTINQLPSVRNGGSGGAGSDQLSISSTGSVTVTGNVTGTTVIDTKGPVATASVIFTGTGTLNVTGTFTTSVFTPSTGIVNYNGTSLQSINPLYTTYGTLKSNNTAGVSLGAAISITNLIIGDITPNSILNDNGKQITSTGTFTFTSGTFNIGIGATATSYPGFTTNTIAAATTVNYNSISSQNIVAVNYGNLTNTANGSRILASSGTIGVKGIFSPGSGAYTITGSTINFNGTAAQTIPAFNYNNLTVTNTNTNITLASGGIIGIAGTFTPGATTFNSIINSTISFNGTAAQAIPSFTFNNLTIDNTAGISSLGGDITINNSLALTNGIVTTGINKVIIPNGGSATRINGWVAGNLQKYIAALSPVTFEIGGSTNYRPLIINFSAITTAGTLTASVTQANGLHPQIASSGLDNTKTVLRYWTLISGGLAGTYDATFGFVAADIPIGAITSSFVIRNYNNPSWAATTTGTTTGASTQAINLTTFGDFAVGEKKSLIITTQPSNTTVCAGNNASFTSASTSTPTPSVKWQRSIDGIIWVDITSLLDGGVYSNFLTNTLNITGATVALTGYQYRSDYSNINGSVNSNAATLTVTALPSGTIDYPGQPFCAAGNNKTVTITGTGAYTGGTFSFSPGGLIINSSTGEITLAGSSPNSYTVVYTTPNCPVQFSTTVDITAAPTATISYPSSPFCLSDGANKAVVLTGDNTGTFSAPAGLSINSVDGNIIPSTSTAGTYLVTYSIPATGSCAEVFVTTSVTITAPPTATISYAGSPFCKSLGAGQPVTLSGTFAYTGGSYSASAGLTVNTSTGAINPGTSNAGTYLVTYTLAAAGGCGIVEATTSVTITAVPAATISYSSSAYCISDISTYSVSLSGTAGAYSGGSFTVSPTTGLSIDGSGTLTPGSSTAGPYTVIYTIPASAGCAAVPVNAFVTINADATINLTSAGSTTSQTICIGTSITSITYSIAGSGTGATFSGLPASVTGSFSGGIATISGAPTASGTFNYTVNTTGTCVQTSANGSITVNALTVGGTLSPALVIACVGANSGTITLSGNTGSVIRWEKSVNAGSTWTSISNTTSTLNYLNLTQPTIFRAVVQNGVGICAVANSAIAQVVVDPAFTPTITPSATPTCVGQPVTLTASGYSITGLPIGGGDFASANPPGWNGASANNNSVNPNSGWGEANGPKVWNGVTYNSSGKFMIINGTGTPGNPILTTPVFSTVGLSTAILILNQAYNLNAGTVAKIEISMDGGSTYTTLQTYTGPANFGPTNGLSPTVSINLNAYLGMTNLMIRFLYAGSAGSNWAIDNVYINNSTGVGNYNPLNYSWTPSTNLSSNTGQAVTFTPVSAGSFTYQVTTTTVGGCPGSAPGTVTVVVNDPVAITTQPGNLSFCQGSNTSMTVTATGTSPTFQWQVSTGGSGGPWTNLTNTAPYSGVTTATLTFTAPALTLSTNFYRVVVSGSAPCGLVNSNAVSLKYGNVWMGTISANWNNSGNWSDGNLPSTSCANVYIPNRANQPVLNSASNAVITNIIIDPGAKVTVSNATMKIAGTITNNGLFDVSNGTLEFNGSSAQSISGNLFVGNNLKNLIVSNTNAGGLTLSGAGINFNILGDVSFGNVNSATLNTGDNLVLISTDTSTARVADITNNSVNTGNKFNGNVTVERYYPALRAWRLVTAPLSAAGSIFSTWQNNGVYTPGRGTYVTGSTAPAGGLDVSPQNNSSLKIGTLLTPVANTLTTNLSGNTGSADNKGYFLFVRGDRIVNNFNLSNSNITTLSAKGKLQTGTQTFPVSAIGSDFTMVGNPYASPVDFKKITKNNLQNLFYVWDPKLNIVGGYVLLEDLTNSGTYNVVPAGPGMQDNIIQSSQAIFVQTSVNGAASLVFNEPNKSATTNLKMFRPIPAGQHSNLRINLYKLNANSTLLADGTYADFNDHYSPNVTMEDVLKFSNINEMVGLLRNNKLLALERRPTPGAGDTIFLKLNKTTQRSYRFELEAANLNKDNLIGFIEDKFLKKSVPLNLNGQSTVDFNITADAASAAADRFIITFKSAVTFTGIKANILNADVAVEWNVTNEYSIKEYEIERSIDGINFTKIASKLSSGNSHSVGLYDWLDVAPLPGYYYYRVRSVSEFTASAYSDIVKVKINKSTPAIYVFPNPVIENNIQLQMNNIPQGVYYIRLINSRGQEIINKLINHPPGTSTEQIKPSIKLLPGIYQLQLTAPDKKITVLKVIAE